PWRKAQLRVSRKIENPETGVHFEPPQGARTQGKRCPVLHGAKLAIDDYPAKSFSRPDELFEARAANRVVDHFGPKSPSVRAKMASWTSSRPAMRTWSAPAASRPSCLPSERVTAMLLAPRAL